MFTIVVSLDKGVRGEKENGVTNIQNNLDVPAVMTKKGDTVKLKIAQLFAVSYF